LIPWFADIPRRTGFLGEMRWSLINERRYGWKKYLRTVDRFVALGLEPDEAMPKEFELPSLDSHPERAPEILGRLGVSPPQGPILALCPGAAYGPAKCWPPRYFAELAREKIKRGWAVWLFGSKEDRSYTREIQTQTSGACLDLAGELPLEDSLDMLSVCQLAVSNDSGLNHVAAALDIPLVVLYGSSDPKRTPPLNPKAKMLYLGVDCSPCFERECPLGHFKCMLEMKPQMVLRAINEL
jgi:heptosyltransferase-2